MPNTAPEHQDAPFLWVENNGNSDGAIRRQIKQHTMHNHFRQKRGRVIGRQSISSPLKWSKRSPVAPAAPDRPSEPIVLDVLSHEGRAKLKELREQKLLLKRVIDSKHTVNEKTDPEDTSNAFCSNELSVTHLSNPACSSRRVAPGSTFAWSEDLRNNSFAQRSKRAYPVPHYSTMQGVLGKLMQPEVLIGNGFDPFHSMPTQCTREDQLALQCIFDVLPETLYGVKRDAEWEPVRSMLFPRVRDHPAMYHLFLLSAATFYIRAGGTLSPSYTARRRSQAYSLVNDGLSDPAQRATDGVFQCVMTALIVEARHEDMGASKVHLSGLLSLLKQRGGRKALFGKPFHVTTVHGLHLAGRALDIVSSEEDIGELHQQVDELVNTLEELQAWSTTVQFLRKTQIPRRQSAPIHHFFPETDHKHRRLSTSPPTPTTTELSTYLQTHHLAFSPPSLLHSILHTFHTSQLPSSDLTYPAHCFLASLLSINFALLHHHLNLSHYLETLVRKLRTNCGPTANIQTLHLHLIQGGLEEDAKLEFERKWSVLDGVRVLGRVSDETRGRVTEALYGFLMGGGREEGEEVLEGSMLERLRAEALSGL